MLTRRFNFMSVIAAVAVLMLSIPAFAKSHGGGKSFGKSYSKSSGKSFSKGKKSQSKRSKGGYFNTGSGATSGAYLK